MHQIFTMTFIMYANYYEVYFLKKNNNETNTKINNFRKLILHM